METPNTPLFVKTHDFVVWLVRHTQRFPKNLRHSFTNRLENAAFDFEEMILTANVERGQQLIGAVRIWNRREQREQRRNDSLFSLFPSVQRQNADDAS